VCVPCGPHKELAKLKRLQEKYDAIKPIDGLYYAWNKSTYYPTKAYPDISGIDPQLLIDDYNKQSGKHRTQIDWQKIITTTTITSKISRELNYLNFSCTPEYITPTGDPQTDRINWMRTTKYPEWIIAKTSNGPMTPDFTSEDYNAYNDKYKSKYGKYPPNAILTEKDISTEVVSTYNNDDISDQEDDGGYDSDLSPYLNRLTDSQKDKFLRSLPCKPTKEDKKLIKTLTSEELGIIRQHRAGSVAF
jgi:hypothetical protein